MSENILYVGMGTDKNHVDVAVAEPLPGGEVRYWGKVANAPAALDRLGCGAPRISPSSLFPACNEAWERTGGGSPC